MMNPDVTYEVLSVNPRLAAEWLKSVRNQSKTDVRLLDSYKRDMSANAWKVNGDPLIFDSEGCLLDGRLRLQACSESGAEFTTLVVRGIDSANFVTIDALRRRTASDIMHIRGEPHGRALAAALTLLWRAGLGDIKKQSKRLSSPELIELLNKNTLVRRSLGIAKTTARIIPHGLGTALHYLFQNENRDQADNFFSEFLDGGAEENGAVFALRRALENIQEEGGRRTPAITVALAFKAWSAYKENREVKLIRYLPEKEDFPETPGLDGLEMPDTVTEGLHKPAFEPTDSGGSSNVPDDLEVAILHISPAEAADILNHNDKNRNIAAGIVKKYVRDMERGDWALNGQTIKISKNGRLLDGQHRLTACVTSNRSFHAIVVKGLDDNVFDTFDVGNKRALADILYDRGEINTALLAGTMRQLWQLENGLVKIRTASPSINELLDILDRHPDIRTSVNYGNNFRKLGTPSQLAALHYCFVQSDPEKAKYFIEKLVHGDELKRGSPILALRDTLIEDKNNPKRKMGAPDRIAITIKSWNAFLKDSEVKSLRWSSSREEFPQISGYSFEETPYAAAA